MLRVAACIAVVALCSCAGAQRAGKAATAPWYGDLHALAEEAARVRGLALTQKFTIVPVDDDTFFSAMVSDQRRIRRSLTAELERLFRAFLGRLRVTPRGWGFRR
jgi:hypothetical protein